MSRIEAKIYSLDGPVMLGPQTTWRVPVHCARKNGSCGQERTLEPVAWTVWLSLLGSGTSGAVASRPYSPRPEARAEAPCKQHGQAAPPASAHSLTRLQAARRPQAPAPISRCVVAGPGAQGELARDACARASSRATSGKSA